jgi:hypothetical protein
MVAACRGDAKAQHDVSQLVGQMLQDGVTTPMGQSLMQIIIGMRDREHLTAQLEGEPAVLVNRILDELNT